MMELYDLWNDATDAHGKEATKKSKTKLRNKKPLPHPGQSYNPHPDDHNRLLNKIAKKELDHVKKIASIKKATKVNIDEKELRQHEELELKSGIEHLLNKSKTDSKKSLNDDDEEGSSTDSAYSEYDEKDFAAITKDKKVTEKRKSKKQRLAQLRDQLQRKAAKLRKLKNIRTSRFDAIKKILKDLDKKDKNKKPAKGRKKLGYKLPSSDPIYCVSSELPSNLRQTSCSMNAIVREQLESFQSRLMVEPTKQQTKKRDKYRKRQFERE